MHLRAIRATEIEATSMKRGGTSRLFQVNFIHVSLSILTQLPLNVNCGMMMIVAGPFGGAQNALLDGYHVEARLLQVLVFGVLGGRRGLRITETSIVPLIG